MGDTTLEKSKTKERLAKIGHVCGVVSQVIFIIACIAGAFCALGFLASFFIDWRVVRDNILSSNANPGFDVSLLTMQNAVGYTLSGTINMAATCVTLYFVWKFFSKIYEKKTPFSNETVRYLMIIGVILLAESLFLPLTGTIIHAAFSMTASLELASGPGLLVSLFVLALALVFKYGAELQSEADTTL